jgi:hypothetical protein
MIKELKTRLMWRFYKQYCALNILRNRPTMWNMYFDLNEDSFIMVTADRNWGLAVGNCTIIGKHLGWEGRIDRYEVRPEDTEQHLQEE